MAWLGGDQELALSSSEILGIKIVLVLKEEFSFLSSLLWAAEIQTFDFLIYRRSVITHIDIANLCAEWTPCLALSVVLTGTGNESTVFFPSRGCDHSPAVCAQVSVGLIWIGLMFDSESEPLVELGTCCSVNRNWVWGCRVWVSILQY